MTAAGTVSRKGGDWRWGAIALLAGMAATFALAPYDFTPAAFVAFPVLVWLLDRLRAQGGGAWAAFRLGWCFGFGYFVGGLWWLGAAMLVDADAFLWALPLAVLGLPAVLAVYYGLALAAAWRFWSPDASRILVLAIAFALAEFARARLFSGFPWNELGMLVAPTPLLMQSAGIAGMHGLTLAAVIVLAAPALLVRRQPHRLPVLALALGLAVLHVGYGIFILSGVPGPAADAPLIRIVQPDIDQGAKWDPQEAGRIFALLLDMTGQAEDGARPDVIVWPESSFPYLVTDDSPVAAAAAQRLAPGQTLLAGAARVVDGPPPQGPSYFNSILAIGPGGAIEDRFDKVHLVPFGEYLPFQSFLESLGIMQLTQMPGGFSAAPERRVGRLEGVPAFLPMICYEVIFPGETGRPDGAKFILNVTNDAWYGDTPGPYQHLRHAQLTAAALGLPLVRAANSGISAMTDSAGRPVASLGLGQRGVFSAPLPEARSPTPYARYGERGFGLMLAGLFLLLYLPGRNRISG